ncbi:hypothetical protein JCM30237_23450 [Halolamina litorea]|uniref:Small CPxCG-related zinc finger protein n=1 Tax=Halolamina litorea TaxID=1515593 RepID=A0ABD6BU14_9EURY|nr:hypothetical protein [Halolamina litorea]
MECEECGVSDARDTIVRYETGDEEKIALCEDCQDAYAEGGLVDVVEPLND